jgi:hypothetical protein
MSLAARLDLGPLTLIETRAVLEAVAIALHPRHNAGAAHGGVRIENIDFGDTIVLRDAEIPVTYRGNRELTIADDLRALSSLAHMLITHHGTRPERLPTGFGVWTARLAQYPDVVAAVRALDETLASIPPEPERNERPSFTHRILVALASPRSAPQLATPRIERTFFALAFLALAGGAVLARKRERRMEPAREVIKVRTQSTDRCERWQNNYERAAASGDHDCVRSMLLPYTEVLTPGENALLQKSCTTLGKDACKQSYL